MSQKKRNLHDTAALRALANGEELHEDHEKDTPAAIDSHSTGAVNKVNTGKDGQYVPDSNPSKTPTINVNSPSQDTTNGRTTSPRRGASNFKNRQNYHVGIQFRKTIIPLLLVMSIILIALGAFTLVKVNSSSPEAIANNPFLDNGTLFAGVSITLGICLIAGSIFFHYEVKKHHRENGGGKKK